MMIAGLSGVVSACAPGNMAGDGSGRAPICDAGHVRGSRFADDAGSVDPVDITDRFAELVRGPEGRCRLDVGALLIAAMPAVTWMSTPSSTAPTSPLPAGPSP